jgi:hypothetical protein
MGETLIVSTIYIMSKSGVAVEPPRRCRWLSLTRVSRDVTLQQFSLADLV